MQDIVQQREVGQTAGLGEQAQEGGQALHDAHLHGLHVLDEVLEDRHQLLLHQLLVLQDASHLVQRVGQRLLDVHIAALRQGVVQLHGHTEGQSVVIICLPSKDRKGARTSLTSFQRCLPMICSTAGKLKAQMCRSSASTAGSPFATETDRQTDKTYEQHHSHQQRDYFLTVGLLIMLQ